MSSIFLPSELIQIIINELHADKPALRSCSLVCHSWAHIAQRCLFTHISFATVWFGPPQNKSLMPRFHTITSTAPHLLRYVRILEFDPTIDAVQYLFANSTTVEEVRLVYFIGDMSKVEDVAEILSLPSVTRLTVRENASYPAQIIPLLRHCPQLRSLTISRVMPDQLAACDPMTLASKAIQLESLALSRLTPEILSDLAENVLDLTQLRSFSAKFHPIFYDHNRIERAVPVLRKLLQSIDGTLEHLTLDVALPGSRFGFSLCSCLLIVPQSLFTSLPTYRACELWKCVCPSPVSSPKVPM